MGYYFLIFKICNGAKQNYCENICTVTLSKVFFLLFFFIKNLVKVHCIHCHPRIKCLSNICSFPPPLPKKVWSWWHRIVVIYRIKNCRFVNLALRERSRRHKMIKYWHVYTCCQEINFPYVAVWQTCILKMYWMKLLLHSLSCIFFQQYILYLPLSNYFCFC